MEVGGQNQWHTAMNLDAVIIIHLPKNRTAGHKHVGLDTGLPCPRSSSPRDSAYYNLKHSKHCITNHRIIIRMHK